MTWGLLTGGIGEDESSFRNFRNFRGGGDAYRRLSSLLSLLSRGLFGVASDLDVYYCVRSFRCRSDMWYRAPRGEIAIFERPRSGAYMLKVATPLSLLLLTAVPSAAPAQIQSLGEAIQNSMNRTSALLRQKPSMAGTRTEPGRGHAQSSAHQRSRQRFSNAKPSPQAFSVPTDTGSLSRMHAATYRLGNGVELQVTGLFRPDAPTACIAYCAMSN